MRTMPTTISGGTIPAITQTEWDQRLAEIAGRELTPDERARGDAMARHNWTLRVVATELFGEAAASAHFEAGEKR